MERLSPEELAEKVKELYKQHGPLCDSEGFYNHDGECWNDALQMIFLNTDEFKEKVQLKLASEPIDPFEVDSKFRSYLQEDLYYNKAKNKDMFLRNYIGFIYTYLVTLQKRFHRHYYAEHLRLSRSRKDSVCTLDDMKGEEALKEMVKLSFLHRTKGEEGKLAAYMGQKNKRYNEELLRDPEYLWKDYLSGGNEMSMLHVISIFRIFFDLPLINNTYKKLGSNKEFRESSPLKKKFSLDSSMKAFYISYFSGDSNDGHAVSFYTCGNRQYFFDDNQGSIEFPWKQFFLKYKLLEIPYSIDIYFNGILNVKTQDGQTIFTYKDYPFIVVNERSYSTYYFTFLWDGTTIQTKTFEEHTEDIVTNHEIKDLLIDFTFTKPTDKIRAFTSISTTKQMYKPTGRANEQTGRFLGARISYKVILDEHLQKVKEGKAGIDDIFYKKKFEEYTPLLLAIHMNDLNYVNKVLQMGANVEKTTSKLETPLFYAVTHRPKINVEITQSLINAGADFQDYTNRAQGYTPLIGAVISNEDDDLDMKHIDLLMNYGALIYGKSRKEGATAIEYAVFMRKPYELINKLVEYGAEIPTCPPKEELATGKEIRDMILSRKIIKAGILAKCYRDMDMYDNLNKEDIVGNTPLKLALELPMDYWSELLVETLLRNGSNPNYVDRFGNTPLHYTISLGKTSFVQILIDYGAKVNVSVQGLGTPLEYAKRMRNPEIIEILQKAIKRKNLPVVPVVKKNGKYTFKKRPPKKVKGGKRKTRKV
jgi:ankyrin repeat protein